MAKPGRPKINRRARKRTVRAKTVDVRSMTKKSLAEGRELYPVRDHKRPKTRGECQGGSRPCPFVSCKHHLYLDVMVTGSIKFNFPDLEVWEMEQTCVLDVADKGAGEIILEEIAEYLNLTRERVRQVETGAVEKLQVIGDELVLSEFVEKRHLPMVAV